MSDNTSHDRQEGREKAANADAGPLDQAPAAGPDAGGPESAPRWPMRLWLAMPDWSFRVIGVGMICAYLGPRVGEYFTDFPDIGPYMAPVIGQNELGHPVYGPRVYFPLARLLFDATFVLIGLAFCFRLPPRQRADRAREIIIPLVAAVWPLLPFLLQGFLHVVGSHAADTLSHMLGFGRISYTRFCIGVVLLCVGGGLEVWGYAKLFRSVSIVAEARELKVSGPYRLVRHPIYLGQFIAQAGVWLVLVRLRPIWVAFFLLFVAMQLYRSRVEDRVLERSFGGGYLAWKRKTFWFV